LTQGIVATDIFKPTRSNAEALREVDLDLKVDLKAPRMEPKIDNKKKSKSFV